MAQSFAIVWLHFRRPSIAGLLALSLWTAFGYFHALEAVPELMSV